MRVIVVYHSHFSQINHLSFVGANFDLLHYVQFVLCFEAMV